MLRIVLSLTVALAFACGGDTQSVSDAVEGAANDVAAQASDAADAAAEAVDEAADATADAADAAADAVTDNAAATNCLGLVADAKFSEAIPVCTEALGVDPSNTDVQQALDRANAEAAKAAAGSAADEATKSATDAMGKALN